MILTYWIFLYNLSEKLHLSIKRGPGLTWAFIIKLKMNDKKGKDNQAKKTHT